MLQPYLDANGTSVQIDELNRLLKNIGHGQESELLSAEDQQDLLQEFGYVNQNGQPCIKTQKMMEIIQ